FVIEKEYTELVIKKGADRKKYDKKVQESIFSIMKQEKIWARLEMIRGVISIKRVQKVIDLTAKGKEAKTIIQDLVNLAQSRFIEHIWKFRCELTAEWESSKKQKGKEKQITQLEMNSVDSQPEQRVNKENQDPLREGSETRKRKKDKKEETKAEIAKLYAKTLESRIKGGAVP
ncbi:11925_t:CDS:2, partial [Gigaspora margarita]